MNPEERLVADFRGTGMTVGPHPMAYHRERMDAIGVRKASDLAGMSNGKYFRIGGCVIARQRPGTAKGFVFLSLEDETGVANAIILPDLFQKNRLLVTSEQFLMVEGTLQNQDNVISGEGAAGNAAVDYPGRDQCARFLLRPRCKRLPKLFCANGYFPDSSLLIHSHSVYD